jgi:hypothetical protein
MAIEKGEIKREDVHRKIGGENGEMVEQGNGKIGRSIYDGNRKGNA